MIVILEFARAVQACIQKGFALHSNRNGKAHTDYLHLFIYCALRVKGISHRLLVLFNFSKCEHLRIHIILYFWNTSSCVLKPSHKLVKAVTSFVRNFKNFTNKPLAATHLNMYACMAHLYSIHRALRSSCSTRYPPINFFCKRRDTQGTLVV